MEKPIYTEKYKGMQISIHWDEDAQSPAEWDDTGLLLVHYHRDFWITADEIITEDNTRALYQGEKIAQMKDYWLYPVAALIHSGVWLSLGQSFAGDSGGWDTSHVGLILVSKKEWPTRKGKRGADQAARSLLDEWNSYLSGDVYGYMITASEEDGKHLGSCWGFYGSSDEHHKENPSYSYCLEEARAKADALFMQAAKRHSKSLRAQIKAKVPIDKRRAFSIA